MARKQKTNYKCYRFIKHLSPFICLKEGQVVNFNLEIKNVFWILFHCTESLSFVYTVYIKVTIVCLQCCLKMYVNINMSNTNSGFPCGSAGKESTCSEGDLGSIPGLGTSPGEGKGYPLQYSGLENSMDCIIQGVARSWTQQQLLLHFQC